MITVMRLLRWVKRLKNDRNPLFTVLWNLRVKSTQYLGNFNNKPFQIPWCMEYNEYLGELSPDVRR